MNNLLSITSDFKKHVASQGMRCSAKALGNPDALSLRSLLKLLFRLVRFDVRNCYRGNARMGNPVQRLFDDTRGREFGIVIYGKDNFARAQQCPSVTLSDIPKRHRRSLQT